MEGIVFIEVAPREVHLFYENVKIVIVINASVIFTPQSAEIVNKFKPKQMEELADEVAPWVEKQMKP